MKFKADIKRRFRKPKTIHLHEEDMMYAVHHIDRMYPKHKLIKINYIS
jgi:hypothetical protein